MKSARFTNFSDQDFQGWWDGKASRIFKPGDSQHMPEYKARHFAKHLTNRELQRRKPDGTPMYKDGEKFTSPKFPERVPQFMELFNKAFTPDEGEEGSNDDAEEAAMNLNKQEDTDQQEAPADPTVPPAPVEDDEADATEEDFEGEPVEQGD